jgi:transcriptional regulator with XRE-family HTH domain
MVELALANCLKRLRAERSISQEELGFRSGLHRTYVSQLERAMKAPSLRSLEALSVGLSISFGELLRQIATEYEKLPTKTQRTKPPQKRNRS